MNSAGIKPGDIVKCDVRGWEFLALVETEIHHSPTLERRVIEVTELPGRGHPRIPNRYVTPRQITDHWRHKRQRKGASNE